MLSKRKLSIIQNYLKKCLKKNGFKDYKEKSFKYAKKLDEMYKSKKLKEHNIYPTMDMYKIYAVILM